MQRRFELAAVARGERKRIQPAAQFHLAGRQTALAQRGPQP